MSPEIRDNLASGGNTETIRKIAKSEGMKTLLDNLRELVLNGTTTLAELRRTYSEFG
jgi:type II secretory ATPase GspE/PulE/Tfp pilus assembly ATPase PilB-like protein